MEIVMRWVRSGAAVVVRAVAGGLISAAIAAGLPLGSAGAQAEQALPQARVIVTGDGQISLPPDYARIRGGVTTRAKTAKEAADVNAKQMSAIIAALGNAGIEQKDIQTARFSVQPVYASPASSAPNTEPKLTGFSVSNQVSVTIRQIAHAGEILDRLVELGATDIGGIEFLHSDRSKALDQAREAAMRDAQRKAEVYARAAGKTLGPVIWVTEDQGYVPPAPFATLRAAPASATPIVAGEDTLHVRITVGFDIAH
jgi:uncharacterized protein